MSGTLYIVATPIGNLGDLTPRAAETFAKADFIAAEDTRVTLKLLNHLGLKKPMVNYYEHNLKERGGYILDRIEAGESCALCSDAGMPAVSDPGEVIVRDAHVRGIPVVPVPAASAAVTALCVSGQPTGRFVFEGFLPTNRRQKPERSLTICRELTKLHEEIRVTTVGDASAYYKENPPRGEFVLVMAGAQPCPAQELTLDDAVGLARKQMAAGQSATAAAKYAAAHSAFSKSEIYRRCLE